jgi:ATP-dependent Clp protease ATP-binding subunit ClpX
MTENRRIAVAEVERQAAELLFVLQTERSHNQVRGLIGISVVGCETMNLMRLRIIGYIAASLLGGSLERIAFGALARHAAVAEDDDPARTLLYRHEVGCLAIQGRLNLLASPFAGEGDPDCVVDPSTELLAWLCGGIGSLGWMPHDKYRRMRAEIQAKKMTKRASSAVRPSPPPVSKAPTGISATLPTARMIYERTRLAVIGLDDQLRMMSSRMAMHLARADMIRSGIDHPQTANEAILVISDSGCGKSWMIQELCGAVRSLTSQPVPYARYASTDLTIEGYVGASPEDPLRALVASAGGDPAKARLGGILLLDEFDKRVSNDSFVAGVGVQQALLMQIEGSIIQIGGRKGSVDSKIINFNTTGIMFVLAGAHSGLDEVLSKRITGRGTLGFGVSERPQGKAATAIHESLVEYGYIPELVNRLTAIVRLPTPSVETISRIISSPHGILASTNAILGRLGLSVELTEPAVRHIAQIACESKGYARHAKAILSSMVEGLVFEEAQGLIRLGVEDVRRAVDLTPEDRLRAGG